MIDLMASDEIDKLKSEVISSNHINQKLKMKPGNRSRLSCSIIIRVSKYFNNE